MLKHALLILTLFSAAALAERAVEPEPTQLEELAKAAQCTDKASPWRPWCIATEFPGGKAAALPSKNLVGITVELEKGKDAAVAIRDKVTFVALAVTKSGKETKVKLTDVKPENDDEKLAVASAVAAVSIVFKGKATTAKLPKALADYAKGRPGEYVATQAKTGWTWEGANPSELRKVGKFWVLIETAKKGNGIWATVLTDAWTADKK
jgi:hypothetical protein